MRAAIRTCASRLQFYVEDCTGCGICVEVCPAHSPIEPGIKAINLAAKAPIVKRSATNIAFFETLPVNDRARVDFANVRGVQFLEPLFEFSGACAGCGETPYLKLLSQLFGDRLHGRERDRLFLDLWRQPARHALDQECRRPRAGLVELAVRGQCRVRARLPPCGRQASASSRPTLLKALAPNVGEALVTAILTAPQIAGVRDPRPTRFGSPN